MKLKTVLGIKYQVSRLRRKLKPKKNWAYHLILFSTIFNLITPFFAFVNPKPAQATQVGDNWTLTSSQDWEVPFGVTEIYVVAIGGGGGGGGTSPPGQDGGDSSAFGLTAEGGSGGGGSAGGAGGCPSGTYTGGGCGGTGGSATSSNYTGGGGGAGGYSGAGGNGSTNSGAGNSGSGGGGGGGGADSNGLGGGGGGGVGLSTEGSSGSGGADDSYGGGGGSGGGTGGRGGQGPNGNNDGGNGGSYGGGGGGHEDSSYTGGGGGGALAYNTVSVTPGTTESIQVGQGGTGGSNNSYGNGADGVVYIEVTAYNPNYAPSAPTNLLCEGQTDPAQMEDTTPEFSAIYNDQDSGDIANKYQIQVDDNADFSSPLWDSGSAGTSMSNCTESTRCADITYAGSALADQTTYYWRIKFWDDDGEEGSWSAAAGWYNGSWSYRRPITIDNSGNGSALSNYQVQVDVTYDSDMNADFSDLRFTDSDGTTELDYWVEESTTTTQDCSQILLENPSATSGIYTINPEGTEFDVYCNMDYDGGGWTLLDNFASTVSGDSDTYEHAIGGSFITDSTSMSNAGYSTYLTTYEHSNYTRTSGYLQIFYSSSPEGYIEKTLPSYNDEVYVKWGNWYSGSAYLKIGGSTVQSLGGNAGASTYQGTYSSGQKIRFQEAGIVWPGEVWVRDSTPSTIGATVWVEVPSIPASSTKDIYMYYGNSGASSTSNAANVLDSGGLWLTNWHDGHGSHPTTEAGMDNLFSAVDYSTRDGWGIREQINCTGDACNIYGADENGYLTLLEGWVYTDESGNHIFATDSDDASDVHINGTNWKSSIGGTNVVSWYDGHGTSNDWTHNGTISLSPGYHRYVYRQEEVTGGDDWKGGWQKPSEGSINYIPSSNFYHRKHTYPEPSTSVGTEEPQEDPDQFTTYFDAAPFASTGLTANDQTNPTALEVVAPTFKATYNGQPTDDIATDYQIQVDNDSDFSSPFWDSGKTSMTDCTQGTECGSIDYGGTELVRGITYYWRIKFWDDADQEGNWSEEGSSFVLKTGCPDSSSTISVPYDCYFENSLGSYSGKTLVGLHSFSDSSNVTTLSVQSGKSINIGSAQSLVVGEINVSGDSGSIVIEEGGEIKPGAVIWYKDDDQDGYPSSTEPTVSKTQPSDGIYVPPDSLISTSTEDCNDNDDTAYDGVVCYADSDGDGYSVDTPTNFCGEDVCPVDYKETADGDCNDADGNRYQYLSGYVDADGDSYTVGGQVDNICSGATLPTGYTDTQSGTADCNDSNADLYEYSPCYPDNDSDGYFATSTEQTCAGTVCPASHSDSQGTDCNDDNGNVYQNLACYPDNDSDGYYNKSSEQVCSGATCIAGYSDTQGTDCDDTDDTNYQDLTAYTDSDGDGYGSGESMLICSGDTLPAGYADNGTDCDDTDGGLYQNLTCYPDNDSDGYYATGSEQVCSGVSCLTGYSSSQGTDCNDSDDSKWQNLAGYVDNDNDGYTVGGSQQICSGDTLPSGYTDTQSGSDDIDDNNDCADDTNTHLCGDGGTDGTCIAVSAGENGLDACQTCNGSSIDAQNIADNTQDTEGSNLCNSNCKTCNGSGSCVNQDSGEDLFGQCNVDNCLTGTCNASGSCAVYSGGEKGTCGPCYHCSDGDAFCDPVTAGTDPNGECDTTACYTGNCDGSGSCSIYSGGEEGSCPACQYCNDGDSACDPIAEGSQDTTGSNLCNGTCKSCDGLGNCANADVGTDPGNDCEATNCSTGNCDGSGACAVYSSGEKGTCGDCYYCNDSDSSCDLVTAGNDPNGDCSATDCYTGNCDGSGSCGIYSGGEKGACSTCYYCNDGDSDCDLVGSQLDPNDDCAVGSWSCDGNCRRVRNSGTCDGGGSCRTNDETDYCSLGDYCSAGTCFAGACDSSWHCSTNTAYQYTCDGSGNCDHNYNGDDCSDCSCTCGDYTTSTEDTVSCSDGIDNDCDGDIDLDDSDCCDANGTACSLGSDCCSGNCVDGYCCNSSCTGTCQACDLSGSVGTCTNVPSGQDPDNECGTTNCYTGTCNGSGACGIYSGGQKGNCGTCYYCNDSDSACDPVPNNQDPHSECNEPYCESYSYSCINNDVWRVADECTANTCNGSGSCACDNWSSGGCDYEYQSQCGSVYCNYCSCGFGEGDCDGDYHCEAGLICGYNNGGDFGCPSTYEVCVECDVDGDCDAGEECVSHRCEIACKDNGQTCSAGSECCSGNCIDGYCCNSSCGGTCEACDVSGSEGTCTNVPNGQDPDGECSTTGCGTGNCNGSGACGVYNDGQKHNCGACQYCNDSDASCEYVPSGNDPNGDCSSGECSTCDGTGQCADDDSQCSATNCYTGTCTAGTCDIYSGGQKGTCGNCYYCNDSDSACDPVTAGTDPNGECSATNCYTGNCDGSGSCDIYSGGEKGNCGLCMYCNDSDSACDQIGSQLDPFNECEAVDCYTGACSGGGECAVHWTGQRENDCPICTYCNDSDPACDNVPNGQDPSGDCATGDWSCKGACQRDRNSGNCDGSGACKIGDEVENVPSGSICEYSEGIIPVNASDYCNWDWDCTAGACSGTQWYTSCNGSGSCRLASDHTDAYSVTVYADAGYSLYGTCGTQNSADCGVDSTWSCDGYWGDEACLKHKTTYRCDGSGNCNQASGTQTAYVSQGHRCQETSSGESTSWCTALPFDQCEGLCERSRPTATCDGSGTCDYVTGRYTSDIADGYYCTGSGSSTAGACDTSWYCSGNSLCQKTCQDASCTLNYNCQACSTTGSCDGSCSSGDCDGPYDWTTTQINGSWDANCDGVVTKRYGVTAISGTCSEDKDCRDGWYNTVEDCGNSASNYKSGCYCLTSHGLCACTQTNVTQECR